VRPQARRRRVVGREAHSRRVEDRAVRRPGGEEGGRPAVLPGEEANAEEIGVKGRERVVAAATRGDDFAASAGADLDQARQRLDDAGPSDGGAGAGEGRGDARRLRSGFFILRPGGGLLTN